MDNSGSDCSVIFAGTQEALRYKWIESEKAGRDLGEAILRHWVREFWWPFMRERWLEHIQGKRRWAEFNCVDFSFLKREFHDDALLVDRIVDRLKAGKENLDVILWALDFGISLERTREILESPRHQQLPYGPRLRKVASKRRPFFPPDRSPVQFSKVRLPTGPAFAPRKPRSARLVDRRQRRPHAQRFRQ